MNNILLDTNILIYLLEGNISVKEMIENRQWFISFISEMELQLKPKTTLVEEKAIQAILNECFIIEMNSSIKRQAIANAKKYKLKLADSIILATAQTNNFPVISADTVFKKIAQQTNDVLLFIP